jgi:hypothetical protein
MTTEQGEEHGPSVPLPDPSGEVSESREDPQVSAAKINRSSAIMVAAITGAITLIGGIIVGVQHNSQVSSPVTTVTVQPPATVATDMSQSIAASTTGSAAQQTPAAATSQAVSC